MHKCYPHTQRHESYYRKGCPTDKTGHERCQQGGGSSASVICRVLPGALPSLGPSKSPVRGALISLPFERGQPRFCEGEELI